jgi:hypothetical protein
MWVWWVVGFGAFFFLLLPAMYTCVHIRRGKEATKWGEETVGESRYLYEQRPPYDPSCREHPSRAPGAPRPRGR